MARIKEEDIRLNIIINGDNGRKEILDLEKSLQASKDAIKKFTSEQNKLIKQNKESSDRYKDLSRQIKAESDAIEKNQNRLELLRRQQSLNTMTIKELNQHLKSTRIALNQAVPGTTQFKDLNKELNATSARLKELKSQAVKTGMSIKSLADVWAAFHMGLRTLKIAYRYIKQATDAFLKYDEALTNAMKTTGLSRTEMDKLAASLKKLDTKTSTEQLIGIAEIGGKLGVAGEDLLGFVSAADKLNVAMGKYLGGDPEAAISSIGKLVDIFSLSPQYGLEDSMLKVGSAMNALGMASTACEGYIVEFSQRLAGIAPSADISIDKVMGLAATLDKYGQSAETSATAIGQVIMAMFKRTETFASIAKMSMSDFANLLNNDVNEALMRVLAGMNDGGGLQTIVSTMSEMHLNGQRASTVLGTLSKNIEDLRAQQELSATEFERGSFVMDAYNKMNQSATSVMEKHKNSIHDSVVEIGEQLLPVVNGVMSLAEFGIGLLSKLIGLLFKYKAIIISLAVAKVALASKTRALNAIKAVQAALTVKQIQLNYEEKYSMSQLVRQLSTANAATKLYAATKLLLTGRFKLAYAALKTFTRALNVNPIFLIASAIGVLISMITSFTAKAEGLDKRHKELTSSVSDATEKINKEKKALDELKKSALSAAKGSEEREKAIKQLNEQYGDYLPALLSEKSSNAEIASAIKEVNTQLERKYYLQARDNDLASLAEKKIDRQKNAVNELIDKYKGLVSPEESAELTKLIFDYTKAIETGTKEEVDAAGQRVTEFTDSVTNRYFNKQKAIYEQQKKEYQELKKGKFNLRVDDSDSVRGDGTENAYDELIASAKRSAQQLSSATKQSLQSFKDDMVQFVSDDTFIKDFYAAFTPDAKSVTKPSGNPYVSEENDIEGNKSWSLNNSKRFLAQKAALTEQFNKGEIASKREYEEAIYQLEVKTLQDRINSNKESGENLLKLKNELQEKIMKHEEKAEQENERVQQIISKNEAARSGKAIDAKIQAEDARWKKERREYAGNTKAIEAIDEQHQRNLVDIYRAGWNDEQKEAQATWQNERLLLQHKMQEELSLVAGNEQAKKAIRDKYAKELLEIDQKHLAKLVASLRDFIEKNKDSLTPEQLEQYYKNLNTLLDKAGEVADATANVNKTMWSGTGDGELFGVSQAKWMKLFDNLAHGKMDADDLSNAIAGIQGAANETFSLWNKSNDLQSSKEKAELEEYKQRNEEKKNILQRRLDAGIISQSDYDQEVEKLENEQAEREKEMAQKQAERERTASIVQAVINTALGVTQTLAQWGLPWGLIPAGIMAAMGAAEIAMIASQPTNAGYAEGGLVKTKRKQDGRSFEARLSPDQRGWVQSPTILVGEEGPEYVIPADGVQNPTLAPFLNTIEQARRKGTLRSLNLGAVYPASVAVGRAEGGPVSSSHPEATPSGTITLSTATLEQLLGQVLEKMDKPVPAVVSMLGRGGLVEAQESYSRMVKAGRINK